MPSPSPSPSPPHLPSKARPPHLFQHRPRTTSSSTSSTGQPRGLVRSHGSMNLMYAPEYGPDDTFLNEPCGERLSTVARLGEETPSPLQQTTGRDGLEEHTPSRRARLGLEVEELEMSSSEGAQEFGVEEDMDRAEGELVRGESGRGSEGASDRARGRFEDWERTGGRGEGYSELAEGSGGEHSELVERRGEEDLELAEGEEDLELAGRGREEHLDQHLELAEGEEGLEPARGGGEEHLEHHLELAEGDEDLELAERRGEEHLELAEGAGGGQVEAADSEIAGGLLFDGPGSGEVQGEASPSSVAARSRLAEAQVEEADPSGLRFQPSHPPHPRDEGLELSSAPLEDRESHAHDIRLDGRSGGIFNAAEFPDQGADPHVGDPGQRVDRSALSRPSYVEPEYFHQQVDDSEVARRLSAGREAPVEEPELAEPRVQDPESAGPSTAATPRLVIRPTEDSGAALQQVEDSDPSQDEAQYAEPVESPVAADSDLAPPQVAGGGPLTHQVAEANPETPGSVPIEPLYSSRGISKLPETVHSQSAADPIRSMPDPIATLPSTPQAWDSTLSELRLPQPALPHIAGTDLRESPPLQPTPHPLSPRPEPRASDTAMQQELKMVKDEVYNDLQYPEHEIDRRVISCILHPVMHSINAIRQYEYELIIKPFNVTLRRTWYSWIASLSICALSFLVVVAVIVGELFVPCSSIIGLSGDFWRPGTLPWLSRRKSQSVSVSASASASALASNSSTPTTTSSLSDDVAWAPPSSSPALDLSTPLTTSDTIPSSPLSSDDVSNYIHLALTILETATQNINLIYQVPLPHTSSNDSNEMMTITRIGSTLLPVPHSSLPRLFSSHQRQAQEDEEENINDITPSPSFSLLSLLNHRRPYDYHDHHQQYLFATPSSHSSSTAEWFNGDHEHERLGGWISS